MIHSIKRIVVSFIAVLACYCVYALAAVPLIEPEIELPDLVETGDVAPNYVERQRQWLESLFLEGDWELTSPKILETAQCILLVKSYKNLPDGKMELRPCTAIFLSEAPGLSVEEQRRQAIVMRASEGAIMQFDSGSDLRQARVGKVIGGRLIGPVTIRSDYKEPGPHDDILVHTSDVELEEKRIWTARPIDFQLGPNRGRGRRMQINLTNTGEQGFRGMKSLELMQEVEVRLEPGDADVFPGNRPNESRAGSRKAEPPVEVRCRGPFRFDFDQNMATFRDQVDVTRMNAAGPSDQLTSELLTIFFKAGEASTTSTTSTSPQLQPSRIEATGNPVIVRAPSNEMQGRGQQLEYDIATGGVTFRGQQDVLLRQGHREIRARQVFALPDDNGQLNEFRATGTGQVRGTTPDGPDQTFDAQWTRSLHFRYHEGQRLLSVEGNAIVNLTGQGTLKADEIHVWFNEVEPATKPAPAAVVAAASPSDSLRPDRMTAIGHVIIDSPQMSGSVNQLLAWFEPQGLPPPKAPRGQLITAKKTLDEPNRAEPPRTPDSRSAPLEELPEPTVPQAAPRSAAQQAQPLPPPSQPALAPPSNVAPPSNSPSAPPRQVIAPVQTPAQRAVVPTQLPAPAPPAIAQPAPTPPSARYYFEGQQLRMQMRQYERTTELAEAIIEHRVLLREMIVQRPDDKPMVTTGDRLHLVSQRPGDEVVNVTGQPAYIEARGLTLSSASIHLDRPRNLLYTDSQGVMTLPADKGIDGMPTQPGQPLEVDWDGFMTFDGLVAHFEHNVVAHRPNQQLRTEFLDAVFARKVNFKESIDGPRAAAPGGGPGEAATDLERIICRNGVWLENRTIDNGQLTTIDRLQMAEMTFETNGDMSGLGPGVVTSWRVGGGEALPGATDANQPRTPPDAPAEKPKETGLTYLNVLFARQMRGNMKRHEMQFEGQVRSLYGPVATWDASLDPDRRESWGPRGMQLTCDHMTVNEMPAVVRDKANYELQADGNTIIEGTGFDARAARLTYAQSKDLLVLEGNGRTSAQLFRRTQPGMPASKAEARKIFYWPSTRRAKIDDAQYIDLNQLPTGPPGGSR